MLVQVGKRFVSEQREIDRSFASGMRELLSKSKVFHDCQEDFLRDLIVSSNRKEYAPNRYLMEEATRGDSMFVLLHGVVEVTSNGRYICKLRDGSIVGEAALLSIDNRRTASIRSVQKCDVAIVFRSTFHSILEKYPREKRKFQRDMKAKLMELGKLVDSKDDINLEQQAVQCDALKKVPFFAGDGAMHDFVAELAMNGVPRWYRPGKIIMQEGDTHCDEMYVLLRGAVEVTSCGEFLGRLENDLFGEIGVLDLLERRTASVTAATQVHCMLFTRQVVIPVLAKYPDARMRLLEHARRRLVALNAAVGGGSAVLEGAGPLRLPGCASGFGRSVEGKDARLFAASPLLRDARVDLLHELSNRLVTRRFEEGKVITSEDEPSTARTDQVCWIVQGEVELWHGGHFLGLLGEGEVFGDAAAVTEGSASPRKATVKSKGRVVLRGVSGASLQEVLAAYEDPQLLQRWRNQLTSRDENLTRKALSQPAVVPREHEYLDFTFMKLMGYGSDGAHVPVNNIINLPPLGNPAKSGAAGAVDGTALPALTSR
uniref:Cyclic nucleotide-binding domain-containing protein n=1 Tax=Alexandrium catenella TaxID=2925 RepID=A0A7S1WL47_ALECA|mmetsp:Transcript_70817/g.188272  ORF Transcript_70817/g.188272 Transcript_70817/m.188272 type:complete len:543 (+) Transcript_70817:104-1732(+)|eukprot:CAMPEP_0171180756 /NCGR_PEP_ID=MMETSP0790-20130122/13918_1 /TAXON_ID=2925 /ORGANISM="Alexandrium catenella, Strain OF101" /LENGTH=542 /DNA_ID=CAMNT_0011645693 /DNA_START=96 /DNA_END=1724 /DNA_ORIENTATION=-